MPVVGPDGGPRPGMEGKVFYVWFDAPIEYIGATEEWAEATGRTWRDWWRTDEGADDVRYVQFMGKDNVAFHTVSFPATILGSGEPWKTVDTLKAFNWLNWYGGKFSTSQKRGVFMDQALELLPADYWRWHLTANGARDSDAAFTWEQFQSTTNKDLADVLGNFVNRIVKFAESKFDGVVPDGGEPGPLEAKLDADVRAGIAEATAQFEAMEFRKAAVGPARRLGAGQRVSAGGRALDRLQDRRRARGGRRAHGPEPGRPVRPSGRAGHAVLGGEDRGGGRARRTSAGRRPDARLLDALPRGQTVAAAAGAVHQDRGRPGRRVVASASAARTPDGPRDQHREKARIAPGLFARGRRRRRGIATGGPVGQQAASWLRTSGLLELRDLLGADVEEGRGEALNCSTSRSAP